MKTTNQKAYAEQLRSKVIDVVGKRVLVARIEGSPQQRDLSSPPNCGGFGRVHHFKRKIAPDWPKNPLPQDPAAFKLQLASIDNLNAQLFQTSACNWRCWYCYVPYRSPFFEANALKAEGISNFPLNWRKGDLLMFVKTQEIPCFWDNGGQIGPEWEDVAIKGFRVKICNAFSDSLHMLSSVGSEEVFPSVSSRAPNRHLANVVTSGNRFLRSGKPELVLEELRLIKIIAGRECLAPLLPEQHNPLRSKLIALVLREQQEAEVAPN